MNERLKEIARVETERHKRMMDVKQAIIEELETRLTAAEKVSKHQRTSAI